VTVDEEAHDVPPPETFEKYVGGAKTIFAEVNPLSKVGEGADGWL
jgi:hypothetical protein